MSACRLGQRPHARTPRLRSPQVRSERSASLRVLAAVAALVISSSASYTVLPGETLSGIAAKLGFRSSEIASANGIADLNRIFAGQQLSLPGSATGGGSSSQVGSHVVALGETLSGIAAKYGVRVSDITAANDLRNADRVRAGARLVIPGTSPGSAPAAEGGSNERVSRSASRTEVGDLIERTARDHGWNPAFVKALAWQESGWNNSVVSSVGARGIMQVMPYTGDFVSSNLAGRRLDLSDPADNVLAGVLFLQHLHELTDGDSRMILAGYYQGLASVRRNGMYESTERYIDNVLALKDRF